VVLGVVGSSSTSRNWRLDYFLRRYTFFLILNWFRPNTNIWINSRTIPNFFLNLKLMLPDNIIQLRSQIRQHAPNSINDWCKLRSFMNNFFVWVSFDHVHVVLPGALGASGVCFFFFFFFGRGLSFFANFDFVFEILACLFFFELTFFVFHRSLNIEIIQ